MNQKKTTLLLIIDSLVKGGAEVMLVGLLPEIKIKFNIILITLSDKCEFKENEITYDYKYSLGFKDKFSLVSCILKLKRIIKKHKPGLVHAHLIYSSLIARIACPANIPLLYSIHGELSKSDFNNSKILTYLEKTTIKKNHSLMAVSNVVLKDYEKTISKISNSFVLHNYIFDEYLDQAIAPKIYHQTQSLKLVAVGNIKAAKNYEYLIKAFVHLKEYPVTLDIYGNTNQHLYEGLQAEIGRLSLKISFNGAIDDVREKLTNYDLFIMSSKNEGFGIAVIEAMACGLPTLLSDIPVMREITSENALFFNLGNPEYLSNLIKEILANKHNLSKLSKKGLMISKQYTKKEYIENLFGIYQQLIPQVSGK
ncbi:MAG: glycosyltransferase [Ginsengibacter sp.]